jgi:hypothetical protein
VNYGFGYAGVGFVGGAWAGSVFRYNTAVLNVNTTVVRNVYVDRTVVNNTTVVNRASFNGPGGVNARPSPQEQAYTREPHVQPLPTQISHEQAAGRDRAQLASVNGGRPAAAAMDRVNGQRFGAQGRPAGGAAPAPARANAAAARPNAPAAHPNNAAAPRPNNAAPAHANPAPAHANVERPQAAGHPAANAPRAEHPKPREEGRGERKP